MKSFSILSGAWGRGEGFELCAKQLQCELQLFWGGHPTIYRSTQQFTKLLQFVLMMRTTGRVNSQTQGIFRVAQGGAGQFGSGRGSLENFWVQDSHFSQGRGVHPCWEPVHIWPPSEYQVMSSSSLMLKYWLHSMSKLVRFGLFPQIQVPSTE